MFNFFLLLLHAIIIASSTPSSTDVIHIELSSALDSASSPSSSASSGSIPVVTQPIVIQVSADITRAAVGSMIATDLPQRPHLYDICWLVEGYQAAAVCQPVLASTDSRQQLPNINNLAHGRLCTIAAWFRRNSSQDEGDSTTLANRFLEGTSLVFVAAEPDDKKVWFSHLSESAESPQELHFDLSQIYARSHRFAFSAPPSTRSGDLMDRSGDYGFTTKYKIAHDIEQLEHIAAIRHDLAAWLRRVVLPVFRRIDERIPWPDDDGAAGAAIEVASPSSDYFDEPPKNGLVKGLYVFTDQDYADGIGLFYNRVLTDPSRPHFTLTEFLQKEEEQSGTVGGHSVMMASRLSPYLSPSGPQQQQQQQQHLVGTFLNAAFDGAAVEARYLAGHQPPNDHPPIPAVFVDNVLSPSALSRIRSLLEEETVWHETKAPQMGGYVGAYAHDGLHSLPFLALGDELRRALPNLFGPHRLRFLWAYKYDSEHRGIAVHADRAAINVNIWLTPDDANLDPSSGGMVVYASKADAGEQAEGRANSGFRGLSLTETMRGDANLTVAYKANRMVLFDSSLFHRTDDFRFKRGYRNRRINLTYLYGSAEI